MIALPDDFFGNDLDLEKVKEGFKRIGEMIEMDKRRFDLQGQELKILEEQMEATLAGYQFLIQENADLKARIEKLEEDG